MATRTGMSEEQVRDYASTRRKGLPYRSRGEHRKRAAAKLRAKLGRKKR